MKKIFFVMILCGLLMIFCGAAAAEEKYWITIDPIPDQMLGATYTISGETNLPEGSKLLFEHDLADWECRDTRVCSVPPGTTASVIQVEQGTKDTNVWRVIMNTSEFVYAREFLVKIYSIDTPARNMATYNLLEPTPKNPWVVIDPIPDQHRETPITITGSVFQPQEGRLLITIQPVWFDHIPAPDTAESLPFVKQTQITVPEGTTELYHWNITLDTAELPPDMYRVEASGIDYDLDTQNRTFPLRSSEAEEKSTIEIFPAKNAGTGIPLTVQGTIDTGKATTLLYTLGPSEIYDFLEETRTGYTRTTPLRKYGKDLDISTWEITLDTAGLKAGEYTLKVFALDAPVTAATKIELQNATLLPQPTQAPGFGFGILALACGAAVIAGALRRR